MRALPNAITAIALLGAAVIAVVVLTRSSTTPRPTRLPEVAGATLSVREPYVRDVPPGAAVTAAYLTLVNSGPAAREVVGATSPAARLVELYTHRDEGGVMRMRRVDRLPVPAGGTVALAPGGYHLTLIDLVRPLTAGEVVPIEVVVDDGVHLTFEAPVRAAALGSPPTNAGCRR